MTIPVANQWQDAAPCATEADTGDGIVDNIILTGSPASISTPWWEVVLDDGTSDHNFRVDRLDGAGNFIDSVIFVEPSDGYAWIAGAGLDVGTGSFVVDGATGMCAFSAMPSIPGGQLNYVLSTDGAGNLSWVAGGTGGGAAPSTASPLMDGTASAGVALPYSREDHVHPSDTSRYAATNPAGYQTAAQVTASLGPYALTSSVPIASSTTPVMDGTAAIGVGTTWARADHIHPTDTSRYAASNPSGYQTAAQVTTSLGPYALIASPTFTGTPAAPTATAGTSTTQLATTAFVGTAITANNTTNPMGWQTAAQVTATVGSYLPLAGGSLTGSVAFTPATIPGNARVGSLLTGPNIVLPVSGQVSYNAYQDTTSVWHATATGGSNTIFGSAGSLAFTTAASAAAGAVISPTTICQMSSTGLLMQAGDITLRADPTANLQAASKQYVDNKASSTTPVMDGTAAIGVGTTWARADHVHPSDTSRLATAGGALTGALTPSSTAGIVGTTTNDNANAGSVGEVISSNVTTGVPLTTVTPANVTSISLTPGDWDVQGEVWATIGAGGATTVQCAICSLSATLPGAGTGIGGSRTQITAALTASAIHISPLRPCRISLATTTTYYLVVEMAFPSGTCTATGNIWARRAR